MTDTTFDSTSESSTDTQMGLVDVCAVLCVNSQESGLRCVPVTLDLTQWIFNKADCPARCRNLIGNSESAKSS